MSTQVTTQAIDLKAPITSLPGVGEKTAACLRRLGIETCRDLLRHWPRRWEDLRTVTPLTRITRDATVVVTGALHTITLERRKGSRLVQVRATLRDREGNEL